MKTCTKCGEAKEISAFGIDASRASGLKEQCKSCRALARKAFVATNRESINAAQKAYYERHRARFLEAAVTRYELQRAVVLEKAAASYRANPTPARVRASDRRARLMRQTLRLTADQRKEIEQIYSEADRLTRETGVPHEVDHDVPLRGKTVSGLHVPWNLVVRTRADNRRKGNKLCPEMLEAA